MSDSTNKSSKTNSLDPIWNIAIFGSFPLVISGIFAAATYTLSNGSHMEVASNSKIAGVLAGGVVTTVEALTCMYIAAGEEEYSNWNDEWYSVRQTEEQRQALACAWTGVGIAALSIIAAGYFGPEYPAKTEKTKTAETVIKIEAKPNIVSHHTDNGFVLNIV